ncbi:MAG TPA: Uma2 family endonuclease [Bryobacteraceae bacterium]|jgi:Uma2 family endonuclease
MASLPTPFLTPAQYVELDDRAECPLEYVDGGVFEIEAGTPNHGQIQANLTAAVGIRLRKSQCTALGQAVRVRVPSGRYFHPDLSVVCGKLDLLPDKTVLNPIVVFEILSDSTADYDLGRKGILYRSIPSLKEYILVDQSRAWVQRWNRQPDSWHVDEFSGLEAALPIAALDVEIPVAEIYDRIEFDPVP